mmetsp:Transcript_41356/g.54368  ORF Transcript_41356/g.54368 Transcript_41356/m.54368 type:complete len:234 (+) Transcript_41356:862-1563(+)
MILQPLGELHGVLASTVHSQRQSLHALEQRPRGHGVGAHAEISHPFHSSADCKADVGIHHSTRTKSFPKLQTMVAVSWVCHQWEFAISPVKRSCINNNTTDGGPVSPNPFGRALHDNIRPMLNGPANVPSPSKRVVHNQRDAMSSTDSFYLLKVRYRETRVANDFHIDRFSLLIHEFFQFFSSVVLGQTTVNSKPWQGYFPLVICSSIQIWGRNNIITGLADVLNSQKLCCMT